MTRYEKQCPFCKYRNTWRPYNFTNHETRKIIPISDSGECEILDKDGIRETFRCECQNCGKTFEFKKVKITK